MNQQQNRPMVVLAAIVLGVLMLAAPERTPGQCVGGQCPTPSTSSLLRPYVPPRPRTAWQPARIAARYAAVVRIGVDEGNGQTGYGSGTLVSVNERHGLVLTNWHVIKDNRGKLEVIFPGGFRSQATVIKYDKDWDLAALLIWRPPASIRPMMIARRKPVLGAVLTVAGFGRGAFRAVTGRVVGFVAPVVRGRRVPADMVEVAVASRGGDSGGPIVNEQGELAGVLFGTARGQTAGSHCLRVRQFAGEVMRCENAKPNGQAQQAPKQCLPPKPAVDPCVALRAQVTALRARIATLEALCQQPTPAAEIDVDALIAAVLLQIEPQLHKPITVQILDADGNVKQQTQAGLGGTLQLQLIPVTK